MNKLFEQKLRHLYMKFTRPYVEELLALDNKYMSDYCRLNGLSISKFEGYELEYVLNTRYAMSDILEFKGEYKRLKDIYDIKIDVPINLEGIQ